MQLYVYLFLCHSLTCGTEAERFHVNSIAERSLPSEFPSLGGLAAGGEPAGCRRYGTRIGYPRYTMKKCPPSLAVLETVPAVKHIIEEA